MQTLKLYLFCLLLCLTSFSAQAQYQIEGEVIDGATQVPLPFAHLILNDGKLEAFADINGRFQITSDAPIRQLEVRQPLYRTIILPFSQKGQTFSVSVEMNRRFFREDYATKTDSTTRDIMEKVFVGKQKHNPLNFRDIHYQSYNKFTLSYGDVGQVKSIVNKILGKFKKIDKTIDSTETNQHLFMMESVTGRDYFDDEHHLETVEASKVSGIEKPTILALTSQLQPLSIYEKEPYILGKYYFGPFGASPFKWYRFELIDQAMVNGDTIFVVKFNPKSRLRIQFLRGYLYINSNGYTVNYHNVSPAIEPKVQTKYLTAYKPDSTGFWIPYQIKTGIIKEQISSKNARLEALNETSIFDIKHDVGLQKKAFSELSLSYKNNQLRPPSYWQQNRKIPYTFKDSLTYTFYDSVGSLRNFERFIRLGEGLIYGEIPYKNVDLLLSRVLDFNQFEGIRLGLGLQTNERFWKHANFGGYFGYGFNDKQWKYGLYTNFNLIKSIDAKLRVSHQKDLWEAGNAEFVFDTPQFSSESLRRYRILIKDKIIRNDVVLEFRPLKFMQMSIGLRQDEISPQYAYNFEPVANTNYHFGEVRLGMRYAYGEHFMESVHRKISFGTEWPILWVQLAKGYKGFLEGDFDYTKIDAKLQNSIRLVGWGTSHFQARMGWVKGKVPYTRLYNGLGSFRTLAAIARNSFETMGYNEFLSDRHFSFFFTHDFGRLHIRELNKQPSFEMSHNFGFGWLRNPEEHDLAFKTMEKGFFESGVFMNNIIVLPLPAVSIGLGAGAFTRYGNYRFADPADNLVFKLAIDFQL